MVKANLSENSPYRILKQIGQGAMGIVYEAEDVNLGRRVALKFLPENLITDQQKKQRFIREAKAAAALNHPNIATVYGIHETDGQLFIAMELVEGESLKQRIEDNSLDPAEAAAITRQVALGLRVAHDKGIIHRDIKPANILINKRNEVKIIDFGLAKLLHTEGMTLEGTAIGTVEYMSPEQARGDRVDHCTDIWSLGAVLYEMITGRLPFPGPHAGAVIHGILHDTLKSISKLNPEASLELEKIIVKALAKNPSSRYPSMTELIKDLDRLTDRKRPDGTWLARFRFRMFQWIRGLVLKKMGLLFLVAPIMILALILFLEISKQKTLESGSGRAGKMNSQHGYRPVTGRIYEMPDLPDGLIKPSFSPDGKWLSFVLGSEESGKHRLCLNRVGSSQLTVLAGDLDVRGPSPQFSPDGKSILFTSYREDVLLGTVPDIWKVSVESGSARILIKMASAADFSPDGRSLVFAAIGPTGTSIQVRKPDGGIHQVAATGYWPRWSPDGEWIAYTSSNPEGGSGHLYIVQPDGSGNQQLTAESAYLYGLCWTPDSQWVVFSTDIAGPSNIMAIDIRTKNRLQLTQGSSDSVSPSVHPAGSPIIYCIGRTSSKIFLVNSKDPSHPGQVMEKNGIQSASISPDGHKIAMVLGGRFIIPKLMIQNIQNGSENELEVQDPYRVKWAPDNRHLLLAAKHARGDGCSIWSIDTLSGSKRWLAGTENDSLDWPDLAVDGRHLAVSRAARKGHEILTIDLKTGLEKVLTKVPHLMNLSWSPDGRWLCWSNHWRPTDLDTSGIWVISVSDKKVQWVSKDGAFPVWHSDSRTLFFCRYHDFEGLWQISIGDKTPAFLGPIPDDVKGYPIEDLDFSHATHWLIMRFNTDQPRISLLDNFVLK